MGLPENQHSPRRPLFRNKRAFLLNGSQTWIRTRDQLINSQLLYQLSYLGMKSVSVITLRKALTLG